MADDILGHENLDHGKHLHKGAHAHGHDKKHGQKTGRSAHGHGIHAHGAKQHKQHSDHGTQYHQIHGAETHVGLTKKQAASVTATPITPQWRLWLGVGVGAILLSLLVYSIYPLLTIALVLICLNAGIEYYKLFAGSIPVDFEILSVGTAYLAAHHAFIPALLVIFLGPLAAEVIRGNISEFIGVKVSALFIVGIAAYLLGTSSWQLFIAVLFGLVAQYAGMLVMTSEPFFNLLRRLTNAGFSAYLLFLLLPGVL